MATPLLSKQMSIVIDTSVLGCATDFSLSVNKSMIEIACLNSTGAKQQLPDIYDWSVSFSGLAVKTTTIDSGRKSLEDLMANVLSTSDPSVGVYLMPDVSANAYWKGAGYISSITIDGGVGSAVTYSGEIVGSGTLVRFTTA